MPYVTTSSGNGAIAAGIAIAVLLLLGGVVMVALGIYYLVVGPFVTGIVLLIVGLFLTIVSIAVMGALSRRRSDVVVGAPYGQPVAATAAPASGGQPIVINNAMPSAAAAPRAVTAI
jgi:Na+-transporting methylmalonyl-CoA/oxaloacetate decarboxylase gamma subunit